MASRLSATARGVITLALLVANVLFWFVPILILAVVKLIVPIRAFRVAISRWLTALGEAWVGTNKVILATTQSIRLEVRGEPQLGGRNWYLMLSNHQSWVDIVALQAVFNRRVPFLKFFIKQELRWVPFLGLAWWAMDMPFMQRYSKEFLARHPEKRGQDLETTRQGCRKFSTIPTTVINFVEGTRATPQKQAARSSPYRHLLPPRAGGAAFVLEALGGILHSVLDVTIFYPGGPPSFWDLCCGRVAHIVVHVRVRQIEEWTRQGDYMGDEAFRTRFQGWLADLWAEKDQLIDLLADSAGKTGAARA